MTMTIERAIVLCEQNAHIHREVLDLIDAGELQIILRGADITDIERNRIENNLAREVLIIEAFAQQRGQVYAGSKRPREMVAVNSARRPSHY